MGNTISTDTSPDDIREPGVMPPDPKPKDTYPPLPDDILSSNKPEETKGWDLLDEGESSVFDELKEWFLAGNSRIRAFADYIFNGVVYKGRTLEEQVQVLDSDKATGWSLYCRVIGKAAVEEFLAEQKSRIDEELEIQRAQDLEDKEELGKLVEYIRSTKFEDLDPSVLDTIRTIIERETKNLKQAPKET